MVQSAFNEIDEIINKIKFLAWSKSPPLWYLTTFKLQNALKLKDMGKFTPENVDHLYNVASEEEWQKVRIVCRITGRIYEIIKPLYEAKTKTANLFLPLLLEIHTCILQESATCSNQFVKDLGDKMLQVYTLYWDEMYSMLSITAFLDPRFKMELIKLKCKEKYAEVCGNLRKIYDSYSLQYDENEYVLSDSDTYFAEEDLKLVQEYNSEMSSVNDQSEKSDFDMYLEEPIVTEPDMENFSVLSWWKENSLKYPKLSLMARDLLSVSMSPGNGNELFYTEPRRVDSTLGSLEEERLMNALSCTRSWKFRYDYS
ncbi:zinc finger BED domain-containing protein DAYSLEEPER-like [Silene latifolia]|uniref:zinc finger BED domain-containing protein DAYSLEEPER-like n=1 Tax=Silene latifolia TaxID=37657 RepID=UPI003D76E601